MEEIWKDIPGYEGMYQVSNLGNVKSLSKYLFHFFGDVRLTKEKILKAGFNKKTNRFIVVLCSEKRKTFCVHQLVAMAFLNHKPCGYKLIVDHIDNNPLNNRVENLQLTTQRVNCSKDVKNKTSKYTGVSWDKTRNKWTSRININKKIYCLGRFDNEEEASEVYKKALNSINNEEN
jgi:hypothetical protein